MKYINLNLLCGIPALCCLAACSDMNGVQQEYIDRGETIYTTKIDSIDYSVGRGKVHFIMELKVDPRITLVEINWTEEATPKKRELPVVINQAGTTTIETTVENLAESDYYFEFITRDDRGHRSMATQKLISIVGENYESMLISRMPDIVTKFGNALLVKWAESPDDSEKKMVLSYIALDGTAKTVKIPHNEASPTLIYDYASGLKASSAYLPERVVDTLYSPAKAISFINDHSYTLSAIDYVTIPAIDFDYGGEGVAYHDTDVENNGGNNYRNTLGEENCGVDIYSNNVIGRSRVGEWMIYTVNVLDEADYIVDHELAVNSSEGAKYSMEVNGVDVTGIKTLVNNGSFDDYRWYYEQNRNEQPPVLHLTRGTHKIKFKYESGGFNRRSMRFTDKNATIVLTPEKGKWSFKDQSNIGKADIGQPLQLVGSGIAFTGDGVKVPTGSYLKCTHGLAASGGGSKVNEYTVSIEYRIPETGKWYSFLQTTLANNDDGELFINSNGTIGVGGYYTPSAVAQANVWQRYTATVKCGAGSGGVFKQYLGTTLQNTVSDGHDSKLDIDGRFALDPSGVLFFADEDGEDGEGNDIYVRSITLWDKALSGEEIAARFR